MAMENLRTNVLGLQEEVVQPGSDTPAVSMKAVNKVRPELLTRDPQLIERLPADYKDMSEDDYLSTMLGVLGDVYEDTNGMEGYTKDQRINSLVRNHPIQLSNVLGEVGRRRRAEGGALKQDFNNMVKRQVDVGDFEVDYYQNRSSPSESREEYRVRTNDDRKERKSNERQQLINNSQIGLQ